MTDLPPGFRQGWSLLVLLCSMWWGVGCATRGPAIPEYRANPVTSARSVEVWQEARGSGRSVDQIPGMNTSGADHTLDEWTERARRLRADAEGRRTGDARSVMDRVEANGDEPRAADLVRLADLQRAGLPAPVARDVAVIIDRGIAFWTAEASDAIARGDDHAAVAALSTVSLAASDGRHPRLELEALDEATRLADRIGTARTESLRPRVLIYTLDRLVDLHVSRPDWRSLVDAGFSAVETALAGTNGEANLHLIRDQFDLSTASSNADSRGVPPEVAAAIREVGERLHSIFEPDRDGIRIFIDGMLAATDRRTRAFYGDDARILDRILEDTYIGIGTEVRSVPEGFLLSPLAGGPARRAGILDGDILVAVDGTSVVDLGVRETVDRVLGRGGTVVRLTVRRFDSGDDPATLVIPVVRGEVERETLNGWRQIGHDRMGRPSWDWIIDPRAAIAYVGIREFVADTDRHFRTAIAEATRELQAVGGDTCQVEGLIIDLRDNGGGRRDATERLLDLFLSDGPLFETRGSRDETGDRTMASRSNTRLEGLPVVILVDEGSASASEMLAGTLQARSGAIVLGERTFGKGSVQQVASVKDGYLVVTESWFLIPDDESGPRTIDRFQNDGSWGIVPDVISPATERETSRFLEERGGWRSGLGQDEFDLEALPTIETTEDRPLLDAVVLLRRRLSPANRGSEPIQ